MKRAPLCWLAALSALLAGPPGSTAALACPGYFLRPDSAAVVPPGAESFLLQVDLPDKPASYLFGTFHSADPDVLGAWSKLSLLLGAKAARLRVFVSERDLREIPSRQALQLPAGQNLPALLAALGEPWLYPQVEALWRSQLGRADSPRRFKPWLVAALLNQAPASAGQASQSIPQLILDGQLFDLAQALKLPTRTLEEFSAIARYYDESFTVTEQLRLLAEAVCNQALLHQQLALQNSAYAANRVDAFYRLLHAFQGSDASLADKLVEVFVARRNAAFWRRLRPEIEQGGAFIAIGNLHLFGAGGLLAQLTGLDHATVSAVDPASLDFSLPAATLAELSAWTLAWLRQQGLAPASVPPPLSPRIDPAPLTALRERLCPGRPCIIEATYLPDQHRVLLRDTVYAQLLAHSAVNPQHYAGGILVRELARAALYRRAADAIRGQLAGVPAGRADTCLKRIILHHASWAQQAYLRARGVAKPARLFTLDPRCPVVEL